MKIIALYFQQCDNFVAMVGKLANHTADAVDVSLRQRWVHCVTALFILLMTLSGVENFVRDLSNAFTLEQAVQDALVMRCALFLLCVSSLITIDQMFCQPRRQRRLARAAR